MTYTLYVVVPCYNEEAVLSETAKRLKNKLSNLIDANKILDKSRIVFVNDGSKDNTWHIISNLHISDNIFSGINLANNVGHQNAVLAGLMTCKDYCDFIVTMDADLQDDIDAIDEMLDKAFSGCEVVYGVRSSRKKDTVFKKYTAEMFYKLMKAMGVSVVFNHADYRLMSKKVLDNLSSYKEVNLFLRGLIPLIGFKSDVVYYERNERFAGESKYPVKKMVSFAINGITSFSIKPLRMISTIGLIMVVISTLAFIYVFISFLTNSEVESGWASIMCSLWFIGGIQILGIGIVGEYIGKTYFETKARPRYIVDEFLNH